jgi:hypothetical protein
LDFRSSPGLTDHQRGVPSERELLPEVERRHRGDLHLLSSVVPLSLVPHRQQWSLVHDAPIGRVRSADKDLHGL